MDVEGYDGFVENKVEGSSVACCTWWSTCKGFELCVEEEG